MPATPKSLPLYFLRAFRRRRRRLTANGKVRAAIRKPVRQKRLEAARRGLADPSTAADRFPP